MNRRSAMATAARRQATWVSQGQGSSEKDVIAHPPASGEGTEVGSREPARQQTHSGVSANMLNTHC